MRESHVRLVVGLDGEDVAHGVELKNVKVLVDGGVEERLELVRADFDLDLAGVVGAEGGFGGFWVGGGTGGET